ncbi:hypothetical protein EYV94_19735 [Puteibacter caeruleilacunae]|nr:hypothetical protein EYV94_19735 [Puteibacter caeruleilacunae]
MKEGSNIRFLKSNQVDLKKWDLCIDHSANGKMYAYSWFLDIVSPDWDALVWGDYQYVMPLTTRKSYGFKMMLQPVATQQLGIFSPFDISADIVNSFMKEINSRFKLVNILLNSRNHYQGSNFLSQNRSNYTLTLDKSYELISQNYSNNTKRNIKKALSKDLYVFDLYDIDRFIELLINNAAPDYKGYYQKNRRTIERLISFASKRKMASILGVYDSTNNLCAAACFFEVMGISYYLFACSTPSGKDQQAMYLLVDHYIKNHCEQDITIDFEGSNKDGIARFYRSFGGAHEQYQCLQSSYYRFLLNIKNRLIRKRNTE